MPAGSSSADTAHRWNRRYSGLSTYELQPAREWLSICQHYLPSSGLALDVAMGAGGSAAFLVKHGYTVLGIDISIHGVRLAKKRCPEIRAVVGDTAHLPFQLPPLDLITNFYYLDRNLCRQYQSLLKPDGLLLFETLTKEVLKVKPELTPDNLLDAGELHQIFQDWRILIYEEKWVSTSRGTQKAIARLAARPPLV
jgi:SAM-dependent methyltransferase